VRLLTNSEFTITDLAYKTSHGYKGWIIVSVMTYFEICQQTIIMKCSTEHNIFLIHVVIN